MGLFECEMLEQRGYVFPEYYCKYSMARIPKETAENIFKTERRRDCADYKRKYAVFPWER